MNRLMINWEERCVWCNVCGTWIQHHKIWLDGAHDLRDERSAHTIWEKP